MLTGPATGENFKAMHNFKSTIFLALLCAVMLVSIPAYSQTAITSTTLSSAVTATQTTVTLASATGITTSGNNNQINTGIFVDREFMWVGTLVSGTTYNVQRGKGAGVRTAHASGATVLAGPLVNGPFFSGTVSSEPSGSCTATAEPYLPRVYTSTGKIYDCKSSGQWILVGDTGTMLTGGQSVGAHCTGALTSGGTDYIGNTVCATTSALVKQLIVTRGVLANLYVVAGAAVTGGSGKDVLTVQVNGSDTALTCTFATGGAATTCSDTTHSVAVKAGDLVSFKFVTATSDSGTDISVRVGLY